MTCSSPFDKVVKTLLLCDTLTLVGIKGYDKEKISRLPPEKTKKHCKIEYWYFNLLF